ncbi:MAG: DUF5067 domain-containing protein [Oscillospiraceae bacterium]|jgi:flagellar basal body-associated protein FliL|nr:DUF5067 domain-containing protein [Oscillospiraceae bacterium]
MNDSNNRGSAYHAPQDEGSSWWKILLAILVVLAVLGAVIAFAMHNKKKDEGVTDPLTPSITSVTPPTITPTENPDELVNKGVLGSLTVEIKSHKIVKDENGKDAIIITYEIENGSNAVMNFLTFLSDTAYQGTLKLSDAVLKDIKDFNGASISEDVQPNAKREVTRAFVLADKDTPVKAIVKQLVTTDSRMVTRTFDIK